MLGKLIKHEFRATGAWVALLCAGVIVFAGLTRLFMLLADMMELFAIPMGISMFFYVLLMIASVVVVVVLNIRRFYKNVYGDEGYLTLTLPVSRWKIIVSKLLVGVTWSLLSGLCALLSLLIIASSQTLWQTLGEVMYYLGYAFDEILYILRMPAPLLIVEIVLMAVISLFSGLLMCYASISLGQLFTGHRLLGSVIGYIGLNTVVQIITSAFSFALTLTQGVVLDFEELLQYSRQIDGFTAFNLQVNIVLAIILQLFLMAGYFTISNAIMKKSVNLQ
ncbi:MAG: hypothetical protein IJ493_04965 [Clostridia bacterium]|nr:hypothetical protein [Clostridia bacterium]